MRCVTFRSNGDFSETYIPRYPSKLGCAALDFQFLGPVLARDAAEFPHSEKEKDLSMCFSSLTFSSIVCSRNLWRLSRISRKKPFPQSSKSHDKLRKPPIAAPRI